MKVKKKYKERSARYRFWRNVGIITGSGLIGGVIGFLIGMFGSESPLKSNPSLVKKYSFWAQYFCFLSYLWSR